MARTITEIQNQIIQAKDNEPSLASLDSTSSTAIWRLWTYIQAVAIFTHETIFDLFKVEIDETIAKNVVGTVGFYVESMLAFQVFDDLVILNGRPVYPVIDESKQIIKRVSVKEDSDSLGTLLTVKVAKEISPGVFGPLDQAATNNEFGSAEGYLDQIKFAGTRTSLISLNPDKLRVNTTIYYDPVQNVETVKDNVTAAINTYLAQLDFDGVFRVQKMVDQIQLAEGVEDLDPVSCEGVAGTNVETFNREYESVAGYIIEDPDNLFEDTIIFIPFNT